MPMFNNLLNLELRQRSINLGSIALLKILQESPNLKTLEFSEVTSPALPWLLSNICSILLLLFAVMIKTSNVQWYIRCSVCPQIVKKMIAYWTQCPPCLLSQLNCIRVCFYHGDEKELSAIKILLENVLVLNKIVIYCSKPLAGDLEKREKVFEQLLKLPRW